MVLDVLSIHPTAASRIFTGVLPVSHNY